MYKSGAGSEPGPQSDPESRLITFAPSQDRKERAAVDRDSGQEGVWTGGARDLGKLFSFRVPTLF